jgi:hypothetical protein
MKTDITNGTPSVFWYQYPKGRALLLVMHNFTSQLHSLKILQYTILLKE